MRRTRTKKRNKKTIKAKAGYMTNLIADGWARAKATAVVVTDQVTSGPADGPKQIAYRVSCP